MLYDVSKFNLLLDKFCLQWIKDYRGDNNTNTKETNCEIGLGAENFANMIICGHT